MVHELKDKVVIITGAASGIGAEVVKIFLQQQIKHVAILDISEKDGAPFQDSLNKIHGAGKVKFYKGDVTNDDDLFGVFQTVLKSHGNIDVVINNAGIMNDSLACYKKEIEINVTALVTGTLKAIELMRKDKGGKGGTVINIASVAGLTQVPDMPIYWATKAAVIQFSNCIGFEEHFSRTGVRILTVCFGATETSLISPTKLGSFDKEIEKTLLSNLNSFPKQSPEDAARGLLEVYKNGTSSSTWIVAAKKPAKDITSKIKKAYEIMSEDVFNN